MTSLNKMKVSKIEFFCSKLSVMSWTPLPKMHFGGANDRINYPN